MSVNDRALPLACGITLATLAGLAALALVLWISTPSPARTLYPGQWAQVEPEVGEWYKHQTINPAANERMGHAWSSCCEHGDVFRTQFRTGEGKRGADEWWYLKDGAWKRIPDDVIHWDEHAPDKRPTLFIYQVTGEELCFYPGEDGN